MAFIRAADVWQLHTKGNQNWPFPAKACQHIYSNADSNGPIFISYVIALTLAYFYQQRVSDDYELILDHSDNIA